MGKRKNETNPSEEAENKKTKGTIPAYRGKVKKNFTQKHATLVYHSFRGFLISCPSRSETRLMGSVLSNINEFLELAYPSYAKEEKPSAPECDSAAEHEKILEKKMLCLVDTGCDGLVFVKASENFLGSPLDVILSFAGFVTSLSSERKEEWTKKLKFSHRWLPIEQTCAAEADYIVNSCETLIEKHFQQKVKDTAQAQADESAESGTTCTPAGAAATLPTDSSFAVFMECRNNVQIQRDELTRRIAKKVPDHYKVNLKTPTKVILAEVFRSVCGTAVLPYYYHLRKYNLLELLHHSHALPDSVKADLRQHLSAFDHGCRVAERLPTAPSLPTHTAHTHTAPTPTPAVSTTTSSPSSSL
eukprot:TRINITY_DN9051_c0_g1::TRINITY_DN9051_c0_g1_i1::g.18211::m.18211 TRINITY_DN9051_c0_g1::TRINITY_DN9051_c0_g1_i1::g.18211  ORF type:complete len:359 (+),score=39.86,THUMP/PF02926.12/0.88,THUMP/PF02926.12/0.00018,Attractin/PF08037.6/0.19 TRINITY_DN9051_c0_g1_i1:64-1140(+)